MISRALHPNIRWNWLSPGARHTIHAPDKFRAIVDREKACADRHHHVFSLVTLSVNGRAHGKALIEMAVQRLRLTDIIGHLDAQRIGILLPHTPLSGAQSLANDICTALESLALRSDCDVSVYPPDESAVSSRDKLMQRERQ